ncbi:hypothetical protein G7Z17_g12709 [Cylindrodendrum hubeiense]|uniref:DUF3824 domain-containing protein n=1 Tax=Cylindrodendrum hubeiense TaxID=595255 RepID=A0A9P5L590_9HYPO|nr:hypothetical protein G7Z17_g12709 [Cylindrodendrum hubeiense]
MASYDPYEQREYSSRRYVREERRDERDPRHMDPRESYTKVHTTREIVPRGREDSELSVEEVPRDFPPPTGRDLRHARPAEPRYYEDEYEQRRGYDSRYDRDYERRSRRSPGSTYYDEDERKSKSKGMSKQEKIIAAVAGAALLAGGKELFDRHEAKEDGTEVQRNPLSSIALAGVGALAAYQGAEFYTKQQAKKDQKANYILQRGRDGHINEYYSDEDEGPKERKGHKNFLESALAATGLGAAVKTLTGGGDDHRSDTRSRRGGSPSSERSRSQGGINKIQKAAMASLLAGATEAFRVSKEPGSWKGEKTKRILTAAAGAATVDAATDDKHGKLGLAESVIGGLVGNRLINGSKNDIEEDKMTGRSRSRSRARSKSQGGGGGGGSGAIAALTGVLGALGAKKALDHSRSRSRSRRGRDDSYSPSPEPRRRRSRSRSRSVVDKARNSLAKLGLGAGAAGATEEHHRRDQDDFSDRGSHRSRRHDGDDYDDDRRQGTARDYYDDERSYRSKHGNRSDRKGGRSDHGSESDLGDSSEDEKRAKKMRGKQIITTGLAAVATIHAAHEVYQSMEKRSARQKAVSEGRLSPAEAKKLKTKAIMQDAASVGIAAMGIKGAVSELKEAKHLTHECKEFQAEKARRHEKRLMKRQRQPVDGRRRADSWGPSSRPRGDGYDSDDESDPRYYRGNPYGGGPLPAPPLGGGW